MEFQRTNFDSLQFAVKVKKKKSLIIDGFVTVTEYNKTIISLTTDGEKKPRDDVSTRAVCKRRR